MDLRAYLAALRRGWLIIVIAALTGLVAGTIAFSLTPRSYASTVEFYVSTPRVEGTSAQSGGQFAESRVNSYIALLSSEKLAQRVLTTTRLTMTPQELAGKVTASTELNTVLVIATVQVRSPERSLQIAQGLAQNFPTLVDDLDNQGRGEQSVVINVVSGPTLLPGAVSPDWLRYLGLGLGAGLLLGVLFALLRDVLDSSVRDSETVQRITDAPVIGTIAFDADSRRTPLIVGPQAASIRAEAFRQLRTNLQFISAARSADVILVTSSLPLEGKSTTAANMALAFVESGERVLLVEADLRRPRVADYLDLPREVGLTNVLAGQVSLEEVIQPWGTDGLSVLASGSTPPNPSELLGSQRMAEVVAAARERFDKIVIDTPPVLPVTDAVVAAAMADAVVLVVRHGRTSRTQLTVAARALHDVDARLVGSVLNMKKQSRRERHTYGTESYYGATATSPLPTAEPTNGARVKDRRAATEEKQPTSR